MVRRIAREVQRWRRRSLRNRLLPDAAPIALGKDPVELHTLVCAGDVRMSLWSLRSFIAVSDLRPRVVVHGDGTLAEEHKELYRRFFDPIVVLDDPEWNARVDEALAPWPTCQRLRREPGFYCARKLFDLLFVAGSDTILYVDSDILFFRRPDALLGHLAAGQASFSPDFQDAYSAPGEQLDAFIGRRVRPRVNSGLVTLPVDAYRERLPLVERFLAASEGPGRTVADVNRYEQTAHALLMTELGAARLPPSYRIVGPLDEHTTAFHFVGDGDGRKRFWYEGVPRLERVLLPAPAR